MEEDYREIMLREDRLTELENELSVSKSGSNGVLSDADDYDFERESDQNGTTLCGTLMRKHRMKRIHHSKTVCIYPGCNGRI